MTGVSADLGPTAPQTQWQDRFRLPSFTLPRWARAAPDRLVYAANTTGAWQVHTWDRAQDRHRRVTDHPNGTRIASITPDGATVCWFADDNGTEIGTWLAQPFAGGPTTPLVAGLPPAWRTGLALGPDNRVAVGLATGDGYEVRMGTIGGPTTALHRSNHSAAPAGFSCDGRFLAVTHCEHGVLTGQALRVHDVGTAATVAELSDGPQNGILGPIFSPSSGDYRIAFLHERFDLLGPGVWDPITGHRQDFALELPGDVEIVDWRADARALVIVHSHQGRDDIYDLELDTGRLVRTPHPPGTVIDLGPRPDGELWYRWAAGGTSPRVDVLPAGRPLLGSQQANGRPYTAWRFTNDIGDTVHGFLALPRGEPPFPTLFFIHGGPHHHDADNWDPKVHAFTDQGWAVAMVNYRGSTGRGRQWLDRTIGDPGRPEVDDIVAARHDLLRRGIADPDRITIAGSSWGGYLTLLTIGMRPDGWAAAVAFSPLADLETAYTEQATSVRSLLHLLFGGHPAEKPELYAERSPITYASRIRTPLLIVAGENDTRCPIEQIRTYTRRLDRAHVAHRLMLHRAGHSDLTIDERIRQISAIIEFAGHHMRRPSSPIGHQPGG